MNIRHGAGSFRNVLLLSLFALLVGCGGGGGGGGGDDVKSEGGDTLGTYDFNLSFLDGYPLEINSNSETNITMEPYAEGFNITGSYNLDTDTITLDGGPRVKVTTNI